MHYALMLIWTDVAYMDVANMDRRRLYGRCLYRLYR